MSHFWPLVRLLAVLSGAVWFAGCQRSASTPAAAAASSPKPAWQVRGEEMLAHTKPGMSQDEILQALGKPNEQLTAYQPSGSVIRWRYDVTNGVFVLAVFDTNGKLLTAKLTSEFSPQ